VATSTLRAAIIVAALVFGGLVLANAFPGTNTQVPSTGQTTSPPTTPTTPATTTAPVRLEGAILQVLNGTGTAGLAADVAQCLVEQANVVIPEDNIGNAADNFPTTTLLWTPPNNKPLAEALRDRFFNGAKLQQGPEEPTIPEVQVTIVVGEDYVPPPECEGTAAG